MKLVVGQHYGCEYCLAACTAVGASRGLTAEQMVGIRRGEAADAKLQALVRFTRRMLATHGHVADGDLADLRAVGYTDAHVTEIVTIIGVVTMASYFNNLNQTELDFPAAPAL